jgi:hypothetical protein
LATVERFRTHKRFCVEPKRDRARKEDGDDVARNQYSEAGRHARCVPPECERSALAKCRTALETGIGKNTGIWGPGYG